MSKVNYYYNKEKLQFEKVKVTLRQRFVRIFGFLSMAFVFSAIISVIALNYIDSPKEKKLRQEIDRLAYQYDLMENKLGNLEKVLDNLETRDNNIYRVIFEADPIHSSVRNAGVGGRDVYKELRGYNNSKLMIETRKRLDNMERRMYVQSKSYDEVVNMVKNKAKMLSSIPAIQPISNKDLTRVASGFGYRLHPIYKVRKFHYGMDFTAPSGTEIYATGNGKVSKCEYNSGGYGNLVVIDHGYGYETFYAHLSKFKVRPGQYVNRGDLIGLVGSSGSSTAPHLHYEVHKNTSPVNPVDFYYNDLSPQEFDKMITISQTANQSFD